MSQREQIFSDTIYNNVSFFDSRYSEEEVKEVLKLACFDDVEAFPKGIQTQIGERGMSLSGGQRQRLSIARTILKNAPILILDEATSAIDTQNEKAILEVLKEISKDKTVITIAHHLETIKDVDNIILLENGKIIAEGKHDELLKKSSEYKKMVEIENKVNEWEL